MECLPADVRAKAVTIVSARIPIDAPPSTVWNVILDFPLYHRWNPFVRKLAITDTSFEPLLVQPKLKKGDHILMHVRLPPIGLHDNDKGLRPVKLVVDAIDEVNRKVVWSPIPSWLFRSVRWQELIEEHSEGRVTTTYATAEAFSGLAAWIIRWFLHKKLMLSFKVAAEALKERSEELAAK